MIYCIMTIVILIGLLGIILFLYNKQNKLLKNVLKDDEKQRKIVLKIKDEFDKQFNLLEKISNYYQQMMNKMLSLDETKVYEFHDDFGVFFKYIKQSIYDINEFYNPTEKKNE